MHVGLRVQCPLFLSGFNTRHISEKSSNIKVHENSSTECRVVPCGQTERWADMMKLIVGFRSLANAHKNNVL